MMTPTVDSKIKLSNYKLLNDMMPGYYASIEFDISLYTWCIDKLGLECLRNQFLPYILYCFVYFY